MRQQDIFASSQILVFNPILKDNVEIKIQYFCYLKRLIRFVKWDRSKYTKAQLAFYKEILCGEDSLPQISKENKIPSSICYLMPYDLAIILAYHPKVIHTEKLAIIINKIVSDFNLPINSNFFLYREFDAALGDTKAWEEVLVNKAVSGYNQYLKTLRK